MASFPKLSHPKTKFVLGITLLLYSAMACVAFSLKSDDGFGEARQQIALRKVGHEMLRYLGDSTSSVLPVAKTGEYTYQIKFEHAFTFKTDSLVKIIERTLTEAGLNDRHVVNVRKTGRPEVVFAYMIAGNKADDDHKDMLSCNGRTQPLGNYVVEINLEKPGISDMQKGYLVGGIPLLALIGLLFSRPAPQAQPTKTADSPINAGVTIGNTVFNSQSRTLHFAGQVTELTVKENQVLLKLAASPNETVERARLQKEIWEDEGVIVGRSLDVFVSKLRKKLEADEAIQLINIRGKGYILEVKA